MLDTGRKIKERRQALGMTQEELAHKVGYRSRASINKIELERDIPLRKLKPIADALEISVSDLMGWEDAEPTEENAELLANAMHDARVMTLLHKLSTFNEDKKRQVFDYVDFLFLKNP